VNEDPDVRLAEVGEIVPDHGRYLGGGVPNPSSPEPSRRATRRNRRAEYSARYLESPTAETREPVPCIFIRHHQVLRWDLVPGGPYSDFGASQKLALRRRLNPYFGESPFYEFGE
jgi:hypothetical protein